MSRLLALDYGSKRIGVAVSDPTGTLATPLPFLPAEPFAEFLKKLQALIQEKKISEILVGIPKNMDGSMGPAAQTCETFAAKLQEACKIPVRRMDERLSTVQAGRLLRESGHDAKKQRTKIDSAAAAAILQQVLDTKA